MAKDWVEQRADGAGVEPTQPVGLKCKFFVTTVRVAALLLNGIPACRLRSCTAVRHAWCSSGGVFLMVVQLRAAMDAADGKNGMGTQQ